MKYIKQFLLILAFTLAGEILEAALPLPIPAAIYGFVLLFIALCTGIIKPGHIQQTGDFLLSILPILFVAPAAGILEHFGLILPNLLPVAGIVIASTFVVLATAGRVTQLLRRRKEDDRG